MGLSYMTSYGPYAGYQSYCKLVHTLKQEYTYIPSNFELIWLISNGVDIARVLVRKICISATAGSRKYVYMFN